MAGVYTDNQPDFSFLQPGETKTWSQYWYPIQKIGPAQHANIHAAASLSIIPAHGKKTSSRAARIGICVSSPFPKAEIVLRTIGVQPKTMASFKQDLAPGFPLVKDIRCLAESRKRGSNCASLTAAASK